MENISIGHGVRVDGRRGVVVDVHAVRGIRVRWEDGSYSWIEC